MEKFILNNHCPGKVLIPDSMPPSSLVSELVAFFLFRIFSQIHSFSLLGIGQSNSLGRWAGTRPVKIEKIFREIGSFFIKIIVSFRGKK